MAELSEEKKAKLMKFQGSSVQLGSDAVTKLSEAAASYTQKYVEAGDRQAFTQNKAYLRGRHWDLGFDPNTTTSTMKRDFNFKPSSLAEKTAAAALKKDLTKEHYALGFVDDPARMTSVYHTDMGPHSVAHEGSLSFAAADDKSVTKAVSIILGSDQGPKVSTSAAAYHHHDMQAHGPEHVDGRARGQELRKSHLLMGTDAATWATNQSSVHTHAVLEGKPAEPVIRKTDKNVTFGTDKPTYTSEIRAQFSQVDDLHEACRNRTNLGPELKKDLRGSHFVFGSGPEEWSSCSQMAFTEKESQPADKEQLKRIRSAMKQVYLTLGNDKPALESAMKEGFRQPPQAMLREAALGELRRERKAANTRPNFEFGTEDAMTVAARECSLQHSDMRVGLRGVDYSKLASLSEEVRADLRKHHFSFGADHPELKTTSQAGYIPPPEDAKPGAMEQALKDDLRKHHFTFGDHSYAQDGGISTTSRDQLVYHGAVETALNPELKADLRAVHFVLGRDKPVTESMYGSTYTPPRPPRLS